MVDDVSTGFSGECRFNETGTALWSGTADRMRTSVLTSAEGAGEAAEVEIVSFFLESPLKSRDKRCLNPDFDEGPEDTNRESLASPGL